MLCTILHKKIQHASPQTCIHKTCIRVKTHLGHSLPETRCFSRFKSNRLKKASVHHLCITFLQNSLVIDSTVFRIGVRTRQKEGMDFVIPLQRKRQRITFLYSKKHNVKIGNKLI